MTEIDTEPTTDELAAALHAARHKDRDMADWARKYGPRILQRLKEVGESLRHSRWIETTGTSD